MNTKGMDINNPESSYLEIQACFVSQLPDCVLDVLPVAVVDALPLRRRVRVVVGRLLPVCPHKISRTCTLPYIRLV